jgi:hypothetical protein
MRCWLAMIAASPVTCHVLTLTLTHQSAGVGWGTWLCTRAASRRCRLYVRMREPPRSRSRNIVHTRATTRPQIVSSLSFQSSRPLRAEPGHACTAGSRSAPGRRRGRVGATLANDGTTRLARHGLHSRGLIHPSSTSSGFEIDFPRGATGEPTTGRRSWPRRPMEERPTCQISASPKEARQK